MSGDGLVSLSPKGVGLNARLRVPSGRSPELLTKTFGFIVPSSGGEICGDYTVRPICP